MNKWLVGLTCVMMGVATAMGQSVVVNEFRNDAPDAVELVVIQDGLNMQGMILKDYSGSGANDGGGAFTFSADPLWASVPAGTIIVLQKTNTATDITVGGGDYNLVVGLQNLTYFSAGSNSFDISTEEIVQIKASGSGQSGSIGAIHTLATAAAGAQYTSAPIPKLKASTGNSAFTNSLAANNTTAALSDFNGSDATGGNATGTIGTYNNANNQTYIESLRGPAVFSVTLDKANGFVVDQGSSDTITATAANGTAPYTYGWTSTLGGAFYTAVNNVFTILDTAPVGSYSATATATDSAAQSTNKTVTFSVAAPATKYAITITPPVNGTVTTTPATEAAAGVTVTITATPAGGFAVDTYSVVGADATPIGSSSTFVMPAQAVTVTVTFKAEVSEGIVAFRFSADPYLQVTTKDANLTVTDMALTAGTIETAIETGTYFPNEPYIEETAGWGVDNQAGAKAFLFTITPAAGASVTINSISFRAYATAAGPSAFSYDIGGLAAATVDAPSAALLVVSQAVVGVVSQTGAIVVKIQGWANGSRVTTGSGVFRLDDVVIYGTVSTGPATFSVTLDKANGFTVDQGSSDTITATAANGTAPYTYGWTSTLGGTFYTAVNNVFTILATAPVGSYSATATATDSAAQSTNKTVTFSVAAPATKYAITITPPVNGTVTTTPATEAAAGATVTITATPAGGFVVDTYSVVGADATPIGSSATFVMPAQAVTVTVTFKAAAAGEGIAAFRFSADPYLQVTTKDANLTVTDMALTAGTIETAIDTGTYFPNEPYIEETGGWAVDNQAGAKAFLFTITPAAGASVTINSIFFRAYATAAGPSAFSYDIGGLAAATVDAPSAALLVVSQAVVGVVSQTGAIVVKVQGWANGSRATTGAGIFRLDDVVIYGTVQSGSAAQVIVSGSRSGTVGAAMNLGITLTNGTAADWVIDLRDPTNGVVNLYTFDFPGTGAFSFTPAMEGSYSLTATAKDGGDATLATSNVTLTVSSVATNPDIPAITFIAGTGFTFTVPAGYTLARVEGADAVAPWTWTTLNNPADYTVSGSTITIKSSAALRRMIRIFVTPL